MRAHVGATIFCAFLSLSGCSSKLTPADGGAGGSGTGGFGTGGSGAGGFGTGGSGAGGYATGGSGTGGYATGGTTGFMTGGTVGTGGNPGIRDASVDAVGGLSCPALAAPTGTPAPIPPSPGCPCTRTPGQGNSYLCPMGAGQTAFAYIGPQGGQISLHGQQSTSSNVPIGLTIPAGALASTTLISITETTVPPPAGILDWSPVYLIEPRGLQLARVAGLQVPWSSNMSVIPKTLAIYARDELGSCQFKPLIDSYTNAGFEQASLTELGYLLVGTPSTIDPSTCTGADASSRD